MSAFNDYMYDREQREKPMTRGDAQALLKLLQEISYKLNKLEGIEESIDRLRVGIDDSD